MYILLLPPLFEVIRADYQVSYTELGLALVAFNALTAVFQTPAGFLVDHIGARIVLICGLLLGSAAVIVAGVGVSFWVFVAMFALAGLGNAVYVFLAVINSYANSVPPSTSPMISVHSPYGMVSAGMNSSRPAMPKQNRIGIASGRSA